MRCVKHWKVIADYLGKAGWIWSWVSAVDSNGEQSLLLTRTAITESLSLLGHVLLLGDARYQIKAW
jgi:hypothetical protein